MSAVDETFIPVCEFCCHAAHPGKLCNQPMVPRGPLETKQHFKWRCEQPGLKPYQGVILSPVFCKCKGKAGFWKTFLNNLGNAIGQAKFGGDS